EGKVERRSRSAALKRIGEEVPMLDTKRREFITLLGGATAAWPLAARAQQQRKIWRVGFLAIPLRPAVLESSRYGAFAQGMRKLGYVEGDNLAIEYRFAEGEAERLSNLVAQLLELKPDVLVVAGTPAGRASEEATTSMPIVMATTNDPIGSGFVQGLARPGGNITGLSNLSTDLSPKLTEMLRSIAPKLSRVAIQYVGRPRSKERDEHDSDRGDEGVGPDPNGAGRESFASGRKRHWSDHHLRRIGR